MRKQLRPKALWIPFGATALLVVVLIALAFLSLRSYKDTADTTLGAAQDFAVVASLYAQLADAESGQRGYVLTSDPAYRAQYDRAVQALRTLLTRLDSAANDASQRDAVGRIDQAAEAKLTELQQTVDLVAQGRRAEAEQVLRSGRGLELMEQIRADLVSVVGVEGAQLNASRQRADDRALQTSLAVGALALATAGLLGWALYSIRRRRVEERLRQANQAKDEFLGMVSHELRTPITAVLGNARLLRRNDEKLSREVRAESLRDIETEAERLQRVVENMLTLSRLERGVKVELEPVLLQRAVERAAARHRSRYPERMIDVRFEGNLPPVLAQEEYLDQVLQNLISNAEKYGAPDQPIELEVGRRAGRMRVSVSDRGPGIDGKRKERIFEPFVRLAEAQQSVSEGVGLGLPVCRRLVEVLGGELDVSERPGGGSCFWFELPAIEEEEAPARAEQQEPMASG